MFSRRTSRLVALLFLVPLAACSSGGSDGELTVTATASALSAPTGTITYLQGYTDLRLVAGYRAEVLYGNAEIGYSNVFLHYGFDGWKDVKDTPLKIDSPSGPFIHATIDVPLGVHSLDYAVYSVAADGTVTWDNDGGHDFHADVFEGVSRVDVAGDVRTVSFITKFESAVLHFGLNGWRGITDVNMNFDERMFQSTGVRVYRTALTNLASTDVIDYCFRDNEYHWDNDGGHDWTSAP